MDIKALIALVSEGQHLSEEQAAGAMDLIMSGTATPAQMAAFLVALRLKGETVAEIAGCARVMRDRATRVPHRQALVVDTAGTGGDGLGTFNISTTAALVIAGAGVPVAKHGNRAASSQSGSADVLEALGVNLALTPEQVGECIDEVGIGFLFAPALHSAMKHVAPVRREIGLRTIFNFLGPLTNPAGSEHQVIGVFRADLVEPVAKVLARLGTQRAMVVHGRDGLDEISICGPTLVGEVIGSTVQVHELHPGAAGLAVAQPESLKGGGPAENARITAGVLRGEAGPRRDVVLLNAAAALQVAGVARNLSDGVEQAARAIDSGRAYATLEALRERSQTYGVKAD